MDPSEIAARVSLPIGRVKRCLRLYKTVPTKFRGRVRYFPEGGQKGKNSKRGYIPASTAEKIIRLIEQRGLERYSDELFTLASKDNMSTKDFNLLGLLLNRGYSIDEAIEKMDSVKVASFKIMFNKKELSGLMKKYKMKQYQVLQGIISGKIKERLTIYDAQGKK